MAEPGPWPSAAEGRGEKEPGARQHEELQEYLRLWILQQGKLVEDLLQQVDVVIKEHTIAQSQWTLDARGEATSCSLTKGQGLSEQVRGTVTVISAEPPSMESQEERQSAMARRGNRRTSWDMSDRDTRRTALAACNRALMRDMSELTEAPEDVPADSPAVAPEVAGKDPAEESGGVPAPASRASAPRRWSFGESVKAALSGTTAAGTKSQQMARKRRREMATEVAQRNRRKYLFGENSTKSLHRPGLLKSVVRSSLFEKAVAALIVGSSVAVGVEVQYAAAYFTDSMPPSFQVMQYLFCIFFTIELVLRWIAEGTMRFFCHQDWQWNVFDVLIVALSIMELVLQNVAQEGHPALLVVRIIRIIRIVRIIRVVRFLSELRMMIYSIYHTLKSLIWSMVLMLLVMYLFAVCLTQATTQHLLGFDDAPDYSEHLKNNWGSIPRTAYTLFKCMSGGISWSDPVKSLEELHWTVLGMFLVFISFTLFAFLNVITGFFCVNASDIAKHDKEQIVMEQLRHKTKYMDEFKAIFQVIDVDNSEDINIGELEDNLQDEAFQAYFTHLNLDIDRVWDIFKLLDKDGSGTVSIEEFVLGCLRLRGPAKSVEVATLRGEMTRLQQKLTDFMRFVESSFDGLMQEGSGGNVAALGQGSSRPLDLCGLSVRKDFVSV